MAEQTKWPSRRINRKLLPVKLIYFTSISAIGTLIPFIPVYMKELGLSATETGILYGVMPFIGFFTRPLIGAFADKIRQHKVVLVVCLSAMGLFYGLLLVTPNNSTDCSVQLQNFFKCIVNETQITVCEPSLNISGIKYTVGNFCKIRFASRGNITNMDGKANKLTCKDNVLHCDWTCSHNKTNNDCNIIPESEPFSKTFIIFFVIYLFANIAFSSIYCLMDAMAYDILGQKRELWGRQRLWGTIGFALFAMVSTFITDMRRNENEDSGTDYSASFYIFIGLCITSAIISLRLKISESLKCKHLLKNVGQLFRYPELVVFMTVITFIGLFFAVIQGFVFWYLKDLGSTQLTLGLCLLTNSVAEVVMFALGGKIIKLIGHTACLYLALAGFFVRFLSFSFISNVWIAPPIEVLHGVCFGLMYDAASEYASIISPKGMSATVQGLIGGLYFGFGRGIGGLVTGKLFDPTTGLGAVWTFRLYALISLTVLAVYAVLNTAVFRRTINVPDMSLDIQRDQRDADKIFMEAEPLAASQE